MLPLEGWSWFLPPLHIAYSSSSLSAHPTAALPWLSCCAHHADRPGVVHCRRGSSDVLLQRCCAKWSVVLLILCRQGSIYMYSVVFFPPSLGMVSKPSDALLLDPQYISKYSFPEGSRQLALPWWALHALKMLMGARSQVWLSAVSAKSLFAPEAENVQLVGSGYTRKRRWGLFNWGKWA